MLFCTTTALEAADGVDAALQRGSKYVAETADWQQSARAIIDGVQAIALQAAALSRYLWPARNKGIHASRAKRLRTGLGIRDDSCLRNGGLRNALEHLDERLDKWCQTVVAGRILPTYVGPLDGDLEVPTHFFRAYYTNEGVFEVLGERFEMKPILEEVEALHARLEECGRRGRIDSEWAADVTPGT
jgi:hypothetical protein